MRRSTPNIVSYLVEELRAQVEEETNRNLYTLTIFSVIFLAGQRWIASIWGMNVGRHPIQRQLQRFLGRRRGYCDDF